MIATLHDPVGAPPFMKRALLSERKLFKSADLGGRVGWLPKAERVKTLFLSPLQPQNAGRWWGGGGRVGIPASFPSRSPPPKQLFPTPTPSPDRNLRGLGGFCGEKAPGPLPLETWPTGPGAWIPPLSPLNFLQTESLACGANPWVRVSKPQAATITPNPLTLGGVGWFPKAELYSIMRGSLQHFSPKPLENLANKPLSPASGQPSRVKNSKNSPVLIGS